MDFLTDNDKVRKTSSMPALEVSVSFGKYGNDLFSCEKRSNLSPNKYLEEVEKCSTAGSVAQKKAYFEAHCQKLATQKTEPCEQEKQNKDNSLRSGYQTGAADLISKAFESNPGKEEAKQETTFIEDVLEKDVLCVMECKKKEFDQVLDCITVNTPRELDPVEEFGETHCIESKNIKEQPEIPISEKSNKVKAIEKVVKSNRDMGPEKIAQSKREKNTATAKKQQMSSIVKPHQPMNPRALKTTLSPVTPASQLSAKANHNLSLSRNRNHSSLENKKLTPKYMNMSLNLGSYGSHPSSVTLSKSFIMEKTEDKDSVKRAFKTCHNNFSQLNSSGEDRSVSKKVTAKGTESRISTLQTTRKENRGAETLRNMKAPNSVSSLRSSDEQTKKTKELLKKVEEKTKPKEGERRSFQSKPKAEQGDAETKNLRKSPNFRAAPAKVFPTTKIVK